MSVKEIFLKGGGRGELRMQLQMLIRTIFLLNMIFFLQAAILAKKLCTNIVINMQEIQIDDYITHNFPFDDINKD